jgi:hypothetical protein
VEKDASSGSSYALSIDGSAGVDAPLSTSDLTRELAQLLAVSIARQQADKAAGVPTNAGLTSLASLVSAVSAQRTLAPVKDGLSALSYAKRADRMAGVAEPGHGEVTADDEPMPIPSTWREPTYDDDRSYRQQMGAALLGLAAGLMIVVPTVLWMSGWFEARRSNPVSPHMAAAIEPKIAEVRTMKVQVHPVEKPEAVSQYVTGSVAPRAAIETVPAVADQPAASALAAKFAEPPATDAQAHHHNDLIAQASRRLENGDVLGAREMLASAEDGGQGPVLFALAETFDPNMLAAWGTRGVAADVARARALYRKALSLGVASAHGRLEALK